MTQKRVSKIFSLFFVLLSSIYIFVSAIPLVTKTSADSNIATWILCGTPDGKKLYNAATTDIVPYSIRSKSNGATTQRTDSFLNMILTTAGFNFDKTNKAILGRSIIPDAKKLGATTSTTDTTTSKKAKTSDPNKTAPRVNPFDRFGVAGLTWSSYPGEWKYYDVDGCASSDETEVGTTEYGKFYKTRKEPKTTYNGIDNSADPRTQQFNRGTFSSWTASFNDMIANAIFSIAKGIVVFTIALVSFSFVDITDVMGLNNVSGGFIGLFNNLYTGFFQPLVALMMILTAIYVFYEAIVKRQVRGALINGLGGSLLCILFAAIIASNPTYWVPFPNRVATYGEAIVVNALSKGERGGGDWCNTNVSNISARTIDTNGSQDQQQSELAKVGTDMKSVIGCRMWEEFLLRPWAQGQFGTNYPDLDASKINNHNSSWVGKPSVPLGGNTVVNNWALFQLSAQTDAHSQLTDEGKLATSPDENQIKKVDGVSSDWYRIVDAFSNYDEKNSDTLDNSTASASEAADNQIVSLKPNTYWQYWIGNHSSERYGTAFIAVIFAGIGSLGPLLFAFLAAIYSVGVTLLMAISPVFLLMGCWAGNGSQIFKGWLAGLLEVGVKKIVATALILISFVITMSAMDLINKIGWIQSIILMLIMTLVMIKSRAQIFNAFANFNFGTSFSPVKRIGGVIHNFTSKVDDVGLAGVGLAYGAYKGHKMGMGAMEGVRYSAAEQTELLLRKSTFGRNALITHDEHTNRSQNSEPIECVKCGTIINPGDVAYRDDDGNYYCYSCGEEMGGELYQVTIPGTKQDVTKKAMKQRLKKLRKEHLFTNLTEKDKKSAQYKTKQKRPSVNKFMGTANKSWLSYGKMKKDLNIKESDNNHFTWDSDSVQKMAINNLSGLDEDISSYSEAFKKVGYQAAPPSVPEPLTDYLDPTILNAAWRNNRYDVIQSSYKQAWNNWYDDYSKGIDNISDSQTKYFKKSIENYGKPINPTNPNNDPSENGSMNNNVPPTNTPNDGSPINIAPNNEELNDDNSPANNTPDNDSSSKNAIPNKPNLNDNSSKNEIPNKSNLNDNSQKKDVPNKPNLSDNSQKNEIPNKSNLNDNSQKNEIPNKPNLNDNSQMNKISNKPNLNSQKKDVLNTLKNPQPQNNQPKQNNSNRNEELKKELNTNESQPMNNNEFNENQNNNLQKKSFMSKFFKKRSNPQNPSKSIGVSDLNTGGKQINGKPKPTVKPQNNFNLNNKNKK